MICPTCGTHIADGSLVCPACHARIMVTMAMEPLQGRWCPSCGVRLDWDDEVCPHCGLPVERAWGGPDAASSPDAVGEDAAGGESGGASEDEDTHQIPRIESAIPAEHDPESKVAAQERMPRRRAIMLASLASFVVIGALILAIIRPWEPKRQLLSGTEEVDTSLAGFPGTVEQLSGQDSDESSVVEVLSGDDATFVQLDEAYAKLARYAERADESEALFEKVAFGDDLDERARGKRECEMLAIDISNLINQLEQVDITSGTYAEDRDNLLTLGNWLRNRVDTLVAAWTADIESSDPASEEERLRALLEVDRGEEGVSSYKMFFDEHYEEWAPQKK